MSNPSRLMGHPSTDCFLPIAFVVETPTIEDEKEKKNEKKKMKLWVPITWVRIEPSKTRSPMKRDEFEITMDCIVQCTRTYVLSMACKTLDSAYARIKHSSCAHAICAYFNLYQTTSQLRTVTISSNNLSPIHIMLLFISHICGTEKMTRRMHKPL